MNNDPVSSEFEAGSVGTAGSASAGSASCAAGCDELASALVSSLEDRGRIGSSTDDVPRRASTVHPVVGQQHLHGPPHFYMRGEMWGPDVGTRPEALLRNIARFCTSHPPPVGSLGVRIGGFRFGGSEFDVQPSIARRLRCVSKSCQKHVEACTWQWFWMRYLEEGTPQGLRIGKKWVSPSAETRAEAVQTLLQIFPEFADVTQLVPPSLPVSNRENYIARVVSERVVSSRNLVLSGTSTERVERLRDYVRNLVLADCQRARRTIEHATYMAQSRRTRLRMSLGAGLFYACGLSACGAGPVPAGAMGLSGYCLHRLMTRLPICSV